MPSVFKKTLEGAYGGALFITALTGDCLQIFPVPVWEAIEAKVKALGSMHPLRRKFMTRANRLGAEVEMDSQGRISIKTSQKQLAQLQTEVVLIGCNDHLELWDAAVLATQDTSDAFSPEDFSDLGI